MTSNLRFIFRGVCLVPCVMLLASLAGCADEDLTPETDEAWKRRQKEQVSIAAAAARYNYRTKDAPGYRETDAPGYREKDAEVEPSSYGSGQDESSSENDAATGRYEVYDYFPGMDAISFAASSDGVPSAHLRPDQTIDLWRDKNQKAEQADDPGDADEAAVNQDEAVDQDEVVAVEPDDETKATAKDSESKAKLKDRIVGDPSLSQNEVIGRNTWMVWCGGNEGFWDWLATDSLGFIDLLKLVDSRKRETRFRDAGMINEPGMSQSPESARDEFGLWLDRPVDDDIRRWRSVYLQKTFDKILAGKHKSQVGLKKGPGYDPGRQRQLYLGDPTRYKDEGYLDPSDYFKDEPSSDESNAYAATGNKYDTTVPPPDMYGISSGVVGLRLFPNPYFDEKAKSKWDADAYYNDPAYYTDPELVRPYRVGMSCAFCHTSFHPLVPPHDVNNPNWRNLSGNIGAQYLSMRATVGNLLTPDQFVYHLLDSQPRGTIDTSLIASDNINNPNTMNAVFGLKQRAILSLYNPSEAISADSEILPSLWTNPDPDAPENAPDRIPQALVDELRDLASSDEEFERLKAKLAASNGRQRHVPRILLDGADSIGTVGALARVYLNIGSYWEQWNEVHQVVLGLTPQRPFKLTDCESNSVYWNATKTRMPPLRDYFLKVTPPMPLLSTEGGLERLKPIDVASLASETKLHGGTVKERFEVQRARRVDVNQLARGRQVFAKNCIVCHSSIQPETTRLVMKMPDMGKSNDALESLIQRRNRKRFAAEVNGEFFEHDPAQWLGDPIYQQWAAKIVTQDPFWSNNYLSTDYRIPVTLVQTNSGRAMGTNGMSDHMWQDFASDDYRQLPSPGEMSFFNPYKGESGEEDFYSPRHIAPPGAPPQGGGPGYYRVPSLISIWATAPLLHNNSLGLYNNDPSVNGRLDAFDDAIRKLLWPKKRLQSSSYNGATADRLEDDHGLIWRTPRETYLSIDAKKVPSLTKRFLLPDLFKKLPWLTHVYPIWLPSTILFLVTLIVLLVSNHGWRRTIGYVLIGSSILLAIGVLVARHSQYQWLAPLGRIYPFPLPVITGLTAGIVLVVPLSRTWARRFGYLTLCLGLAIGTIVYFNAGRLGMVRIGPIPAGTPVNLLANFNSEADTKTQARSIYTVVSGLAEIESRMLAPEDASKVMKEKIAPALMEVNKCPDFVMDRGHYFPWFDTMSDDDKNALIELLKTF